MTVCTVFPPVDEILLIHQEALGGDLLAYRNHVYRVLNYVFAITPVLSEAGEMIQIAAAFHDLGIWTSRTFDYLGPSRSLARDDLASRGVSHLAPEVETIIEQHHKLRSYRGPFLSSVESFRRADLVDVSLGVFRSGLSPRFIHEVKERFPNAGFHARLVTLTGRQVLRSPLRPLPMFHW